MPILPHLIQGWSNIVTFYIMLKLPLFCLKISARFQSKENFRNTEFGFKEGDGATEYIDPMFLRPF